MRAEPTGGSAGVVDAAAAFRVIVQHSGALALQEPGDDLDAAAVQHSDPVVHPFAFVETGDFGIVLGRAAQYALDAGPRNRAEAHRARLARGGQFQRPVLGQVPGLQFRLGQAQRHDLAVGTAAGVWLYAVDASRDQAAVLVGDQRAERPAGALLDVGP